MYDYKDCLLQTNPGSTCILDVNFVGEPRQHIFKGMYICLGAMKEGYRKGLRKCIGLDGCFLKGVFKGQLLSATTKNGNNQIYPIAWAVVHNETSESWTWFLEQLSNDLTLRLGDGLTVVTDMQKPPTPKRRKLPIARGKAGYGVMISERTEWTCLQNGRSEDNIVISTGSSRLKSSAVVTGDLGFTPTSRKWKGKDVVTQPDLLNTAARKQAQLRSVAFQNQQSQSQPVPPTNAQRQRAAANKEAAKKRLARFKTGGSQPNPSREWKY